MPYDEVLADRLRVLLRRRKGITEKKMFGGVCFLINGNMFCGITEKNLVLRLGEQDIADGLEEPHTGPFDMTGKTMKMMLYVFPKGYESDEHRTWIERAVRYARSLPAKKKNSG
jgi:TfoX/Sxy family transcriptional regulator of competence genes